MRITGRWFALPLFVVLGIVAVAFKVYPAGGGGDAPTRDFIHPKHHDWFAVSIMTTGELKAPRFVPIEGPKSQNAQIYQTKITWLVPEGTVVQPGDRVAELDRAPAATRMETVRLDLRKAEAEYTNAALDSALTLAQAREDVRTAEYLLEEKRLARQQAQYEAPTIKRQAEIDYDRASRALDQAKKTLDVKAQQATAKLVIANTSLERQKNNLRMVEEAEAQFTVRAPASGMVIYLRDFMGRRKGVGSQYYAFEPTVATLPDLARMQSQTYVNEADIKRIKVGQRVDIGLDALPNKRWTGEVVSVANTGEQRLNQDAKVFEVLIDVTSADTTLRPTMTTSNRIEVAGVKDVISLPVSAVHREGKRAFVYKRDGRETVRQIVELGPTNDVEVVVTRGLRVADEIVLRLLPGAKVERTVELK